MNILFNRDIKEYYGEDSDKFFILINAALSFFQANPGIEDPKFSGLAGSDLIFNDNSCADMIVDVMTQFADRKELYVSPYEFTQAALSAANIRANGKEAWVEWIKKVNAENPHPTGKSEEE